MAQHTKGPWEVGEDGTAYTISGESMKMLRDFMAKARGEG